jgi:LPXTG-site transpeptidase (sortase) family protein
MTKQRVFFHLGNALIIVSLLGFGFTFYPVIQVYLFPQKNPCAFTNPPPSRDKGSIPCNTKNNTKGFSVAIPKIGAYAPVIQNVNPWNEFEYKEALKKGVAHAKGTSLPGGNGTVYLFAHSSGAPWEITRFNTIFLRLGELQNKDTIIIVYKDKQYQYEVIDKKEVWPNETYYLESTLKNQLILQTCTPIGTSLKRLLIFSKLIN